MCSLSGHVIVVASVVSLSVPLLDAQSRRVEAVEVQCPSELGVGVETNFNFCDVLIGDEIADGILLVLPPHRGPATVTFSLHGRHTYSEDDIARGRGYARYLARAAVATSEAVLSRPVALAEFHSQINLFDRIGGGAGPGGLKAVAPVGNEEIRVTVPSNVTEISIVGLELEVQRVDGVQSYTAEGRPIALISNAQVDYRAR